MEFEKQIVELENKRHDLISIISGNKSTFVTLISINNFFNFALLNFPPEVATSYLIEFIDEFLNLLNLTSDIYYKPEITNRLLSTLSAINTFNDFKEKTDLTLAKLKTKAEELEQILEGKEIPGSQNFFFPVLEVNNNEELSSGIIGFLESITVKITQGKRGNKFIIIPSEQELEKRLQDQIRTSFDYALAYVKQKRKKIIPFYDVIIDFRHKFGYYEGNSLGAVLSILFTEQLLKCNNTPEIVSTADNIAITGGHDPTGNFIPVGEEAITKKLEVVFYSGVKRFIFPKADEAALINRLTELKNNYPERKIELIPLNNIKDLFNRRDLIEIKKQNPVVRTVKEIINKKYYYAIIFVLVIIIGLYLYRDWDDNPAVLDNQPGETFVKNKEGRILWSIYTPLTIEGIKDIIGLKRRQMVLDINNDGKNEILMNEGTKTKNVDCYTISCYDKSGFAVWSYAFTDSVRTKTEILKRKYSAPEIIDTITFNGRKLLMCSANNLYSFTSAMFFLDIKTGQRTGGLLWHAGHIQAAEIADLNDDKKQEIVFLAVNNSYERPAMGIIGLEKVYATISQAPSKELYKLQNIPPAEVNKYILFPNIDYTLFYKHRNTGIFYTSYLIKKGEHLLDVILMGAPDHLGTTINYKISFSLKDISVVIGSELRVRRDSLVKKGILNPPYTDTPEYCKLLVDQIEYWDGTKFISRKEWLERNK